MADKKIIELDLYATIAGEYYFVMYDTNLDKTVRIPISALLDPSGSDGQILTKDSSAAYNASWKDLDPPKSAVCQCVTSAGVIAITTKPFVVPLNHMEGNDIPGLTIGSSILTVPTGTYLLTATVGCLIYDATSIRLYLQDETQPIAEGPVQRCAYGAHWETVTLTLQHRLQVTSASKDITLRIMSDAVGANVRIGQQSVGTFVTYSGKGVVAQMSLLKL